MQNFLVAFLPVMGLMLSPFLIILAGSLIGLVGDLVNGRRSSRRR